MTTLSSNHTERDALRLKLYHEELVDRIGQTITDNGEIEPLEGVYLTRLSTPLDKIYSVLTPSLCIVAQGSKAILLGDRRYQYDPFYYFLSTIELPLISHVVDATHEKPYLSLRVELNPNLVSSVITEAGYEIHKKRLHEEATQVSPLTVELLDALVRLVRLLETPDEAQLLLPLIKRELVIYLLSSRLASKLCHLTMSEGTLSSIAWAVEQLKQNYDQSLYMDDLAQQLGMSVSSFYQHFKAVTAMTPLQFQKRIRLQEARRLMLSEGFDATSAAYEVGYRDAAYFSREYKSLFGAPPKRDIQQLRQKIIDLDVKTLP